MKKFRLTTIHLVLVSLILFGLLAVTLNVITQKSMQLLIVFALSLLVFGLFWYQKSVLELDTTETVELMQQETNQGLSALLERLPVGIVKFSPDMNGIDWFNPYAELILSDEDGAFDTDFVIGLLHRLKESPVAVVEIAENKYQVTIDYELGMFYFYDNLSEVRAAEVVSDDSPVIGIISIDNYDDVTDPLGDTEVAQVNAFVSSFISDFAKGYAIFYKRVDLDRFYFFTDYAVLSQLMTDKFSILGRFKDAAQASELTLTMSMGISYGGKNHAQIGQIAQQNLNMALVRGGDQVVVKENDNHKEFQYFGGGSVSTVKRSRTRTRAMMTAIADKIKLADQVFVVGHRQLDMDALGSAIGMAFFASNLIEQSFTVYEPNQMAPDIKKAIDRLSEEDSKHLITVEEALSKVTEQSLLIMVDHSKVGLTLSEPLYQQMSEVIVVDHHRRDDDFPTNAVLSYIESGASSASELVTELIQFQNTDKKLTKLQASILMAGIMLDTKNFSTRVTSRTFDVASYLRTLGSDSVEIHNISATDFEEYRAINELVLRGERLKDNIIMACGSEEKTYSNVIISKAADTILDMSGIEAAFVVTKTDQGKIAISARSRSKINVQRIMESMGGGGHFNLAACQLEETTLDEAVALLRETIQTEISE